MSTPSVPPSTRVLWRALRDLVGEYTWFTRSATLALIGAALMNLAVTAGGDNACWFAGWLCWMPGWLQRALGSDGALAILTLVIALFVGVHLKMRMAQGLLDASDHYDIGRALAYGYFSNFLVSALALVRSESERLGLTAERRLKLWMVFPDNVNELERFKNEIEPAIRSRTGRRDLEGVYRVGGALIKRSILVVTSVQPGGGDPVFFDFPTTLYTLHDYYQSWNTWQTENRRTRMAQDQIDVLEQDQVSTFLRHLKDLSRSEAGAYAVRHTGLAAAELTQLFDDHFEHVHPDRMRELLSQPQAFPVPAPPTPPAPN